MNYRIIIGLLPLIAGNAYSADARLISNSPFNPRGSIEKASTNKSKTSFNFSFSSSDEIKLQNDQAEVSSKESSLSVTQSLGSNLDLGLGVIYNTENSSEQKLNDSDSAANVSLGAKYQFLDGIRFKAAVSTYIESGYGSIDSNTASSKSKIAMNGLATYLINSNLKINLVAGYKYFNNAIFSNYQMIGELSEAVSLQSSYSAFAFEVFAKARQLQALNTNTIENQNLNGLLYGANLSADVELATIGIFAEFSADEYLGIPTSSYGVNLKFNLEQDNKKPALQPESSATEEITEQTDVDTKAGLDNDALRFRNYQDDPSLIMNELVEDTDKVVDKNDIESMTEYRRLKIEKKKFTEKYENKKTEYQKIKEQTADYRKKEALQKKRREKKERAERIKSRRELRKKIAAEKKFNEKINKEIDEEVRQQFKQDPGWEEFDGLNDKGQEEIDELEKELSE